MSLAQVKATSVSCSTVGQIRMKAKSTSTAVPSSAPFSVVVKKLMCSPKQPLLSKTLLARLILLYQVLSLAHGAQLPWKAMCMVVAAASRVVSLPQVLWSATPMSISKAALCSAPSMAVAVWPRLALISCPLRLKTLKILVK